MKYEAIGASINIIIAFAIYDILICPDNGVTEFVRSSLFANYGLWLGYFNFKKYEKRED